VLFRSGAEEAVVLEQLEQLLAAVHRAPAAITLAQLDGAAAGELAVAGSAREAAHRFDDGSYALDRETAAKSPFALLRSPPLVLSRAHPVVAAALRGEPGLAASHLARALLLHYRLLTAERSEALLAATLARLGWA
jgi:hypothetical protein